MPAPTEQQKLAEEAFERAEILRSLDAEENGRWARMALVLYAVKESKDWTHDGSGCASFGEWLVHGGYSFQEKHANNMIGAYRTLVVEHGVAFDEFASLDATKVREVLPAIRRVKDPQARSTRTAEALADCKTLPRSDLRIKYANPTKAIVAEDEPEWCQCTCGNRHKKGDSK